VTIGVTGASGFVGRTLLPMLAVRFPGAHLRALVLPGDPFAAGLEALVPGGLQIVPGDVTAPETVDRLAAGAAYVLHLAGLISYWRLEAARLQAVNVDGVRNVVDSCARRGVRRLLHVSSVGAIGFHPDGTPADEDTPFNWPESLPYMTTKRAGQQVVEDAVRAGRLDAVVVNPASVMGPGDPNPATPHNRLYGMFRRPGPAVTFSGGLAVVDVRDLCDVILAALERGAVGGRYLAVGANVTYAEVVTAIARGFGREVKPIAVSAPLVTAGGALLELASRLTRRRPLLTAGYGRLSGWTAYYANGRSRQLTGRDYRPFADTVRDGCRFYERLVDGREGVRKAYNG
jgi:dihydroflavonol-4-reductase